VREIGAGALDDSLLVTNYRSINSPSVPPIGAQFVSLTGIQDYTYSAFKLNLRDNDDIVWLSGEPAPQLESAYCTSNTAAQVRFDRNVDQTTAEDPLNYFFQNLGDFAASATLIEPDLVQLTVSTAFVPGNVVPEQLDVSNVENTAGVAMVTESTTFIAGVNTIEFVQTIGSGIDSSQVAGEIVTVEGIITADNTYDFVRAGYPYAWVQSAAGGEWSGVMVYDRLHKYLRGQEVRIASLVSEYYYKTELDDPVWFEVLSEENPLPTFAVLPAATLASPALAEPYEGCLVRIENVEVLEDTATTGFDEWTLVHPGETDTVVVGMAGLYFYEPQIGDQLGFVQGPCDYDYNVRIEPRRWDDIDSPNGIGVGEQGTPARPTALHGGHPNPFNPATSIRFDLGTAGAVTVKIYDESGRLVRTLLDDERLGAGRHELSWDGRDDGGASLASGIYLYRFEADGVTETRKLALVK
jgi:hypothetical protein